MQTWKFDNGNGIHTYRFTTKKMTFGEAIQEAQYSFEGNLAVVDNQAEQDFITNTILQNGFRDQHALWIGATDREVEGQWRWVNGGLLTYDDWYNNEPNDSGGNEDAAIFNWHHSVNPSLAKGDWNDFRDDRDFFGLIEVEGDVDIAGGCNCVDCPGQLHGAGAQCQYATCNWRTGSCQVMPTPGVACNDGNDLTLGDMCDEATNVCIGEEPCWQCMSIGDPHHYDSRFNNGAGQWHDYMAHQQYLMAEDQGVRVEALPYDCVPSKPAVSCNKELILTTTNGEVITLTYEDFQPKKNGVAVSTTTTVDGVKIQKALVTSAVRYGGSVGLGRDAYKFSWGNNRILAWWYPWRGGQSPFLNIQWYKAADTSSGGPDCTAVLPPSTGSGTCGGDLLTYPEFECTDASCCDAADKAGVLACCAMLKDPNDPAGGGLYEGCLIDSCNNGMTPLECEAGSLTEVGLAGGMLTCDQTGHSCNVKDPPTALLDPTMTTSVTCSSTAMDNMHQDVPDWSARFVEFKATDCSAPVTSECTLVSATVSGPAGNTYKNVIGQVPTWTTTYQGQVSDHLLPGIKMDRVEGATGFYSGTTADATYNCPALPTDTCTATTCEIAIVVDRSDSVAANDAAQRQFVGNLVNKVVHHYSDARIALVLFGSSATIAQDLTGDVATLQTAISNFPGAGGTTHTSEGIELARDLLVSNARQGVSCMRMYTLTDGVSDAQVATAEQATIAMRAGIASVAVGVGSGPSVKELEAIATYPDSVNVFQADTWQAATTVMTKSDSCLQSATCALPPINPTGGTWAAACKDSVAGGTCALTCAHGTKAGDSTATCSAFGTWDGVLDEVCDEAPCTTAPDAVNGVSWACQASPTPAGQSCTLDCPYGLKSGDGVVTCDNGAWRPIDDECVPSDCPTDMYTFNGATYQFTSRPMSWTEATAEAATAGGWLVSVNSAEEMAFINNTVLTGTNENMVAWIGLHTPTSSPPAFKWSSNAPITYTNWEDNTGVSAGHYVAMNHEYSLTMKDAHKSRWTAFDNGDAKLCALMETPPPLECVCDEAMQFGACATPACSTLNSQNSWSFVMCSNEFALEFGSNWQQTGADNVFTSALNAGWTCSPATGAQLQTCQSTSR